MPADDQVQQPLEVVLGDDRQVVHEDVAAEKDRARTQDQTEGMQCRQVLVVDIAEESLLYARPSQPNASWRRSDTPECSLVAVARESGRARNACRVRLTLAPQLSKREHP